MSLDLLEFPPEINELIFRYCSKPDLINVACCSKFSYDSVKPFLWKIVRIRWSNIHKASNSLEVFQFTTALQFCLERVYRDRRSYEPPVVPLWNAVAPFYENIILNCNADRLSLLTIINVVSPDGLDLTFKKLKGLEHLSICNNLTLSKDAFNSIGALKQLRRLTLKDCNVENSHLQELTKLPKLEDLYIDNSYLDDVSIQHISDITTLKRLTFSNHDSNISGNMFKDLYKLNRLLYLNVDYTKCNDHALLFLCEHLKELRCLSFNGCADVTEQGLSKLHCLVYLQQLDFHSCRFLTNQLFLSLLRLPSLRKITFTLTYEITVDVFPMLGTMASLQDITIVNPHRRFSALEIESFCKSSGMTRKEANMSTAYHVLQLVKPRASR